MIENMQLWLYGTVAVVDTVLLFALVERHNWKTVTIWMVLLALGVWSWHSGIFVRSLVEQSVGPLAGPIRWISMIFMAFGLLLMPCASLHGTARLLQHRRFTVSERPEPRLAILYLPLLLLVPMGRSLAVDPAAPFLDLLSGYQIPYLIWLTMTAIATALGFWIVSIQVTLYRRTVETPSATENHAGKLYQSLAVGTLVIAALADLSILLRRGNSPAAVWLQPLADVSPILPAILFAYFVMRFQLLPMIVERTLVYGAILMGAMLFHQLVWRDAVSAIENRYRLDLAVLEGALALLVIMVYQPFRTRVAEALQSLVDSRLEQRDGRRHLAVQLAMRSGEPLSELAWWFTAAIQQAFGTDLAATWICDRNANVIERAGTSSLLNDAQAKQMMEALDKTADHCFTRYSTSAPDVLEFLETTRAGAMFWFRHADIAGLFLIGCRPWGQPPSDEDLHSLSLLVEQFGITLQNSQLQAMQLATEHRLLQQEKLSTLGLLAGSLAHEIKNPLSSIKTIARVLAEEFGPDSRHAEDLRMISGEVDRLAASTSELLEAARPPRMDLPLLPLSELLSPTLRLLQHLAREHKATLRVTFPEQPVILGVDQIGLREIVFNLMSNALESAAENGFVGLTAEVLEGQLTIEITDTGPGFCAEQQARLFEPFYTTKQKGTGLGLYVVARRIREMGGQIECHSQPNVRTAFLFKLPVREAHSNNGANYQSVLS